MNNVSKLRVAFVNTHPIQYFAPLYAYLTARACLPFTALYLSDFSVRGSLDAAFGQPVKWDVDLLPGYDVRFVAKIEPALAGRASGAVGRLRLPQ